MEKSLCVSPFKEDYGITSLYNALLYLLGPEEIEDAYLEDFMRFYIHKRENRERKSIGKWFYEKEKKEPVTAQWVEGKYVEETYIEKVLREKGCVIVPIYKKKKYILVTKIDNQFIYAFDPYKEETEEAYNRKIDKNIFFHSLEKEGALGPVKERTCLSLTKRIKIFDYEKNEGGI